MLDRFEDRWKNRSRGATPQPALVTVTVCEQVLIDGAAPDSIWRLVWDPATSPLVLDNVVAAFTIPGTPPGKVGEMQMHVVTGPNETLIGMIEEVVELGPGYRAVTRSRSTAKPNTSTTMLVPLAEGGCVLRHTIQLLAPAQAADDARTEARTQLQRYLACVSHLAKASLHEGGSQ